jgi:hypothetical protein
MRRDSGQRKLLSEARPFRGQPTPCDSSNARAYLFTLVGIEVRPPTGPGPVPIALDQQLLVVFQAMLMADDQAEVLLVRVTPRRLEITCELVTGDIPGCRVVQPVVPLALDPDDSLFTFDQAVGRRMPLKDESTLDALRVASVELGQRSRSATVLDDSPFVLACAFRSS